MYNYQTFLRENKFKQKCEQLRKQRLEISHSRQKKIPSMIQSHKKRVQAFILAMVQRPLVIEEYRNSVYKPRQFIKEKIMGKTAFFMNFHTQKERVMQESRKNKELDQVPFSNPSMHHFRQQNQDIQIKPFKYTSLNSSMRVKETLEKSTLNYLDLNLNKKIEMAIKSNSKNLNNKNLIKMVNKTLLPQLHQKTHFHSIKTIYSQSPCSFLKVGITNQKQNISNDAYEQQTQVETRKQIQKISNDLANRKQNSKQALIKCGILKLKKDQQKDSHLIHSSSLSSAYK